MALMKLDTFKKRFVDGDAPDTRTVINWNRPKRLAFQVPMLCQLTTEYTDRASSGYKHQLSRTVFSCAA